MNLSELDLKGYGHFDARQKATFIIDDLNLPSSWEFIFQNRRLLLKVDQYGPVYAQADPPSDIVLFRRDLFQPTSSWVVWLQSASFPGGAITNFFRPNFCQDPAAVPQNLRITYSPQSANYVFEWSGLRCATEISIPADSPAVCMKVSVTNTGTQPITLSATPALRPYVNPAALSMADKPEWYVRTSLVKDQSIGFLSRLFNSKSQVEKRRAAVLWSEAPGLTGAEISYERFVGAGSFERPQAVFQGRLGMRPSDAGSWGQFGDDNSIGAYPSVWALQYDVTIPPGQTREIRQVVSMLPPTMDGSTPDISTGRQAAVLLDEKARQAGIEQNRARYDALMSARTIHTGADDFDRYVNEFLPLQLDWVCSLDRGWPSGMRGSRDSANDFVPMVPLDAQWSRRIIQTLLSCQRFDGWFPRQYSASGRLGVHDLRPYVDAGNWGLELLHYYLCHTKDFALLSERLAWMDSDSQDTVLTHALRTLEYYLDPGNIGEHGLCKIGEGDWLDAVNRCGVRGRGESVMVTNQTIISLALMSELMSHLKTLGAAPANVEKLLANWAARRARFMKDLRTHAFNASGYFNSNFNDDGVWLFSDHDPDGEKRVSAMGNWWSIASGAAGDLTESVLKHLEFLKASQGYRLYWPPMGKVPIPGVGRAGTGDTMPGRSENGNVYNQGSHGFLGRALAVAGKGDLLFDVLQWMLPYDQDRHPLREVMAPPYGMVNCWQDLAPFKNRAGMALLTGSIAYALRMAYDWMLGIRPRPAGLVIDPCLPSQMASVRARFVYLSHPVELEIRNPCHSQAGAKSMTLNGRPVTTTSTDPFSGRTVFEADDKMFVSQNKIVVDL